MKEKTCFVINTTDVLKIILYLVIEAKMILRQTSALGKTKVVVNVTNIYKKGKFTCYICITIVYFEQLYTF